MDKCNFCNGPLEKLFSIKSLPIFTGVFDKERKEEKAGFSMAFCKNCELIQQRKSRLLDKKLKKIYLSEEAMLSTALGEGKWGKRRLDDFLHDADLKDVSKKADILEIGCGSGKFLLELWRLGWRNLSGFEPSILSPKDNKKYKIYNDFFSLNAVKTNKLKEKFDLIVLTGVLEHISNLKDFLKAIYSALKKNGCVLAMVPNESFSFKATDPGLIAHEHLNYFTPMTLKKILEYSGFEVISLRERNNSLVVKFKIAQNFNPAENYSKNIFNTVKKFKNILKNCKSKIGLYGACLASFNLLSLSGISEAKNKNILFIDSDPLKWGKKMLNIPVIPPSEIMKFDFESIIIIPPAFSKEIFDYLESLNLPKNIKIIKEWQ